MVVIDYVAFRTAANEAFRDFRGDINRIIHDLSVLSQRSQQVDHQINSMLSFTSRMTNLEQQNSLLLQEVRHLQSKIDQLTNEIRGLTARLSG